MTFSNLTLKTASIIFCNRASLGPLHLMTATALRLADTNLLLLDLSSQPPSTLHFSHFFTQKSEAYDNMAAVLLQLKKHISPAKLHYTICFSSTLPSYT